MVSTKDLISVIIPVYNVEKYLRQCIESVLNQTYMKIEVILVDDGSTDSSGKICDEYALKDERIRVVHKQNGGLSSARNVGIEMKNGEWLIFVDSDDILALDAVDILYNAVTKNKLKMAVGNFKSFESEIDGIDLKSKNNEIILSCEQALEELIRNQPARWVTAWGKIYHRSLFEEIRYPLNKIYEDTYVMHLLIVEVNKIVQIENIIYFYRQHEASIMSHYGMRKIDDLYTAYLNRMKYLKKHNYKRLYQIQKDNFEIAIHEEFINREKNDIGEVIKYYRKYYRENFWSFPLIYKVAGFINCLRKNC